MNVLNSKGKIVRANIKRQVKTKRLDGSKWVKYKGKLYRLETVYKGTPQSTAFITLEE